jgi:two-component system, cell cycle sensor histidine kinase and response regulator CckA
MTTDPVRSLVDLLTVAACIHRGGRMLHANGAFLASLGHSDLEQCVGRPIAELLHEDDAFAFETRAHAIATDGGSSQPVDVRWRRVDNESRTLRMSAVRMPFEGEPAIVEIGPDATASMLRVQMTPTDQLASAGSLASGIAHEINNPLTYVLANLDCIREQLRLHAARLPAPVYVELDEIANEAKIGAERVARIVQSIRIFSRVDDEQRAPIDLAGVLEAACALAWNEIRHRARLVKIFRPLPSVDANDARLTLVFYNLFINAAQAVPEGRADENQIQLKTWTDGGRAVVEIRDTGTGIAPVHLPRIFDPFFTTKPQGIGTGLGLSICHGIVSALGGEISVETTVGVGTAFRVTLPAYGGSPRAAVVPTRVSTGTGRSGRILVIDDDAAICTAIRRTLGRRHQVMTTTSGREALDRIRGGERFDLILCDLMMPVVTGMEVHAEVAQVAPDQADRMVFLTGGAFTSAARDFLQSIPNERFDKPFDGGRLRVLAKEMVDDQPPSK